MNQRFKWSSLAILVAALLLMTSAMAQSPVKKPLFFFVGDDKQNATFPTGIDDKGNIVGYYYNNSSPTIGFIRDRFGRYKYLNYGAITKPMAINIHGIIVGTSGHKSWSYHMYTGKFKPITVDGAISVAVTDINDDGVIVGTATFWDATGKHQIIKGFVLEDGSCRLIDTPGQKYTLLNSINNKGQIAGDAGPYRDGYRNIGFIVDPDGSRQVIELKANGVPVVPLALGDNGDFVDSCEDFEGGGNVCMWQAKTQKLILNDLPSGCYSGLSSPSSMRHGAITGHCYGYGEVVEGFVISKASYLN